MGEHSGITNALLPQKKLVSSRGFVRVSHSSCVHGFSVDTLTEDMLV